MTSYYGAYNTIALSDLTDKDGKLEIEIGEGGDEQRDYIRRDDAVAIIEHLAGLFDIKRSEPKFRDN